jgi:hypothetical protein
MAEKTVVDLVERKAVWKAAVSVFDLVASLVVE